MEVVAHHSQKAVKAKRLSKCTSGATSSSSTPTTSSSAFTYYDKGHSGKSEKTKATVRSAPKAISNYLNKGETRKERREGGTDKREVSVK